MPLDFPSKMSSLRNRNSEDGTSRMLYGKPGNTLPSSNVVSSPLNQSRALNLESVPIIKDSVFHIKPEPSASDDGLNNDQVDVGTQNVPSVCVTPPSSPIISNSKAKYGINKGEIFKQYIDDKNSNPSANSLPIPSRSKSLDHQANDCLDLNNVEVIDDVSINRWLMRIMRLGASYTSTGSNGYNNTGSGHSTGSFISGPSTASSSSSPSSNSPSYLFHPVSYLHHRGKRRMSLNVMDQGPLLKLPTTNGWRPRRLSDSSSIASGQCFGAGIPIPSSNLGSCLGSSSGYMSTPATSMRASRLRRGILYSSYF